MARGLFAGLATLDVVSRVERAPPRCDTAGLEHHRRSRRDAPRVLDAGRWKPQMATLLPRCTDVVASAGFRVDDEEDDVDTRLARLLGALASDVDGGRSPR